MAPRSETATRRILAEHSDYRKLLRALRDGEGTLDEFRERARVLLQRYEEARQRPDLPELSRLGIKVHSEETARRLLAIKPHIDRLRHERHYSVKELCKALDDLGVKPARSRQWSKGSLHRLLKLLDSKKRHK